MIPRFTYACDGCDRGCVLTVDKGEMYPVFCVMDRGTVVTWIRQSSKG